MIKIIPVNLEETAKLIAHIEGAIPKATRSAIRRTLKGAKQFAARKAGERYTSPQSLIKDSIEIKLSSDFSGELTSKGARNPLEIFKVSPSGRIKTRGRYIKATVVKGQGGLLKRAFKKSSSEGIWERTGAGRFPLRRLKSVSAPGMFLVPQVSEPVLENMETRFKVNFAHEASAILGGFL